MTPSTFCFTKSNHFICVERKGLITRVYLVFIARGFMIGLVMDKGLFIGIKEELDDTNFSESNFVLTNKKPYSFIKDEWWDRLKNVYMFDKSIFQVDKDNFRIEISEITAFDYTITDDKYSGAPLHGVLFLSTSQSEIKLHKPYKRLLYSSAAKFSRNNTKPLHKKLYVIQNQATNFDASYTAVRNWLIEQNV